MDIGKANECFEIVLTNEYVELLAPFDQHGLAKIPRPKEQNIIGIHLNFGYVSKAQSMSNYSVSGRYGGDYCNGNRLI